MNAEKLIEEVRKFPVLYDQSNEKYRNTDYKERVWKIIATTLEVQGGVDDCKKKWASIRDQLRRTLQKRKTKSGQAAEKARKYKYEDILTFLLPYLGEREGLTNVPQVGDEEDDDFGFGAGSQDISTQETYEEEKVSNVDEQHTEEEKNLTGTILPNRRSRESSSQSTKQVSAIEDKFATPSAIKRKIPGREVKPEDSPASQLMAYILAEKEAEKQKAPCTQTCNPVDAFLCGIAPTLKSLDAILLNEAKGKIFDIVQELELKQLQLNVGSQDRYFMPNYSTSPSPSSAQSSSSSIPQHITIPNYSTLPSPSTVQSPSPSSPSHTSITTADETTNLNERSHYHF